MKCLNKSYAKILLLVSIFLVSNITFCQELISKTATIRAFEQELREKVEVDGFIKIGDIPHFVTQAGVPEGAKKLFKKIEITSPKFGKGIESFEDGFSLSGEAKFKEISITAELHAVLKNKTKYHVLQLKFDAGQKLSNLFGDLTDLKGLKAFDFLKLPSASIVLTEVDYEDGKFGNVESGGINFFAKISALTGPLRSLENLINELKKHSEKLGESFSFKGAEIRFAALIKQKLFDSHFRAFIPLRIGLDFTKIVKKPKLLKFIRTGDFVVDFSVAYEPFPVANATVSASILLGLTTQPDPLEFKVDGNFSPGVISFSGYMTGMLDLKWFALGEVGIQLDYDFLLLPTFLAMGIPFTGFGLRGKTYLGREREEDKRREIELAALVSFGLVKTSDIAFVGNVQKLNLSDFVSFLAKLANVKLLFDLPAIELSKLKLYFALFPTSIAGKDVPAGITFDSVLTFGSLRGEIFASLDTEELKIAGTGRLNNIETKFFKLIGPGPDDIYGTEDDGPIIDLLLSALKPKESHFTVDGQVEIPPLGIKQRTRFSIGKGNVELILETKLLNLFAVDINLNFPLTKPKYFFATFDLKQDFIDYFRKNLTQDVTKFFDDLQKNSDEKIKKLKGKIAKSQLKLNESADREINRIDQKIEDLDAVISKLDDEIAEYKCSPSYPKICAKKAAKKSKKATKKVKKKAYKAYKKILLKPGLKLSSAILKLADKVLVEVVDRLTHLKAVEKMQEKVRDLTLSIIKTISEKLLIINVKRVSAEVFGADLLEGKSPKLNELLIELSFKASIFGKKIDFKETIELKDVQFDFKQMGKSIMPLAKKIFERLKEKISKKVDVSFETEGEVGDIEETALEGMK